MSGGGEYYLTVYLKFNVDEHDEEEAAAIMLPRARVVDEKARAELRPWVCGLSRIGSSFSTGRLDSSAAGQPARAPQSRITSSARSVGKSKSSHITVCLLNENDEQIAIACVGMADVDIPIILGISGEL